MAFEVLQSTKERAEVLNTLSEMNKRAGQLYERMILEGAPVQLAHDAAQEILTEAGGLALVLSWYHQPIIKADPKNGVSHFSISTSLNRLTAEPGYVAVFSMLAATESIRIRNAEDGENDGIHTIDQVYSNALDLTTGTSLVANADDETMEIVWHQKYTADPVE